MNSRDGLLTDKFFWLSLLFGGFVLSFLLWLDFGPDQALFSYIAMVWKKYHLLPYIGAFSGDFPGIFIIHRLVLELFGSSILGLRMFDFLVQLSCLAMIYYLTRRLSGSGVAGFLACITYSIYYYSLFWNAAQRDVYALCLLLIAAIVALNTIGGYWIDKILAGLLAGFAFLIKPTFGIIWPFFGFWFLFYEFKIRRWRVWPELALYSISCLAPALIIIYIYWSKDNLTTLYQSTFWYDFNIYGGMIRTSLLSRINGFVFISYSLLHDFPLIISGAIIGVPIAFSQAGQKRDKKVLWLLIWLSLAGLVSLVVQGRNHSYHRVPFIAFVIIFAAQGWAWIAEQLKNALPVRFRRASAALWYLMILAFMLASLDYRVIKFAAVYSYRSFNHSYGAQELTWGMGDQKAAAAYMKTIIKPGDEVQFYGWHPFLNYLLEKKLPSRFCGAWFLLYRPWNNQVPPLQRRWMEKYTSEVISVHPRFFVISTFAPEEQSRGFTILRDWDLKRNLEKEFPELKSYLLQNYVLTKTIGTIEIYELKTGQAKAAAPTGSKQ